MNSKKIIALLLSLVIVLMSFASCAKDTNKPDDGKEKEENPADKGDEEPADDGKIVITDTFYPQYGKTGKYKEMKQKLKDWFVPKLEDGTLFSAKLDGKSIAELKSEIKTAVSSDKDADGNEIYTATYTYEAGALEFVLTGILYSDNPSLDMVMRVNNTSASANSPKISELYVLNAAFPIASSEGGYEIHTNRGSADNIDDFLPVTKLLTRSDKPLTFAASSGSSSNGESFPFFDVIGRDEGLIVAIGWSGMWEAAFANKAVGEVTIFARQQNFDAALLPGESIRTPSVVMTYFTGDYDYGHNVFRRNIISHYTPQVNGDDHFIAPISLDTWGGRTAKAMIKSVSNYADSAADLFWVDAGWYSNQPAPSDPDGSVLNGSSDAVWHRFLGAWAENKNLFPSGIKEVFDFVHENSKMKNLLWWMIEDARGVVKNEWLFGEENYYMKPDKNGNLDYTQAIRLDRDETADMLISYFSDYMDNKGMDCIRLDKSVSLNPFWSYCDEIRTKEDGCQRNGITEAKYIENFYRVWDTLYEKYPNRFFLDNCSSGGRRIDIEMTKRSMPLWRTDYTSDLVATQAMTQYLSAWLPLTATGCAGGENVYNYRSYYSASTCVSINSNDENTIQNNRKIIDEFVKMRPYWYGDYYQLLTPDREETTWQSYELYREDLQKGFFIAIRRGSSPLESQKIRLKGLIPERSYKLHNIDAKDDSSDMIKTGEDLMTKGITLRAEALGTTVYTIELIVEDGDIVK